MSPIAHIVDDDEAIRDALTWLFRSRHVDSRAWPSAEAFLVDWRGDLRGCLVLDVRMGGMSGLQLFDLLSERGSRLPVIFLSGHGDIPLAARVVPAQRLEGVGEQRRPAVSEAPAGGPGEPDVVFEINIHREPDRD